MIKNIIFVTTIIFGIVPQLYSMEIASAESPDQFSIQTDKHNLRFRRIDLHKLNEPDRQTLLKEFGDFDAVSSMFGYCVAIPFKIVHWLSPEKILDIYRNEYDKKLTQMPEGQKIMYQWMIENQNTNEYIGKLSITTYTDERPEDYKHILLLEIGLFITEKYRNKKITTTLAHLVKSKLEACPPFNTGIFCFSTRTDNQAIHRLAMKQEAALILTHQRVVDFELFSLNELCDLFVIPKK